MACGGEKPAPTLLARVGDKSIHIDDLIAFERAIESGDSLSAEAHRQHLNTLVDREVLILEARAQGLETDAYFQQVLAGDIETKLAEMMFNQEVSERSAPTPEEIEAAYATGDWKQQVVSVELFLPDEETALRVRAEILNGMDIFEAGRLYSVDRLMHIPMGGAQQFVYSKQDGPAEVVQRVFQIPAGSISSPIPLFNGFVLAYVAEYRDVQRAEVADELARYVRKEKRRLLRGAYLQHLNKALNLQFSSTGLERAVAHLSQLKADDSTPLPADSNAVVYSYGDASADLGTVVGLMQGPARRWPEINSENIVAEIKNTVLPNLLMAANARERDIDSSPEFLAWKSWRSEDLLLSLLRKTVCSGIEVSEDEVVSHYRKVKRRFRIPGYARVRDVLVATREEAVALKEAVENGADFAQIIEEHSLRKGSKKGVFRVFALQANKYGSGWMNYAFNVPIGQLEGPVQAEGGFSLLEVVERVDDAYYSLDESRVRSAVTRDMQKIKERSAFNEFVRDVRARRAEQITLYQDHLAAVWERP